MLLLGLIHHFMYKADLRMQNGTIRTELLTIINSLLRKNQIWQICNLKLKSILTISMDITFYLFIGPGYKLFVMFL